MGDQLCPGLYLRVSPTGIKSWSAVIRTGNRVQRKTLGRYPVLTLASARAETLALLRAVADGSLAAAEAAAASAVPVMTLGEVIETYVAHLSNNARSWRMIAACLRRPEMVPLHSRPADAISKRELIAVVDALTAVGTPHAAVSLLRYLKMAFNFAVERDLMPANPLDKVRPPVRDTQRDRVLTDDEIGRVWRACEQLPQPWCAMVRMLMLTGCRRNEIARLSHGEIQGDQIVIRADRMKMRRPHAVPLVPAMVQQLSPVRPAEATGYVFSNDGGATAASNFAKIKLRLDAASGVTGWVIHDLRRTLRTGLAAMGVPKDVARAVVGHADGKVDAIYNRHQYAAEKRKALERWAEHLAAVGM